ncbi:MAG: hypothetical protein FJ313_03460, partial [Gemmatimonadetes bacterium]|nr:hypothetical protein [Gemmatimonadota bacterium]
PGVSGYAVVDSGGRLAGLGVYSTGAGVARLGYAVAADTIAASLPSLREGPFALAATPTPAQPGAGAPIFGPRDGEILHDATGRAPVSVRARVDVADSIVSATFINPYPLTAGSWSYGIRVRLKGMAAHTVFVRSDLRWHHWYNDAAGNPVQSKASGHHDGILIAENAENTIKVVTAGSRGWLFINDQHAATLDLTGLITSGDVEVVTGLFSGDQRAGEKTEYRSFAVRRVGSGPSDMAGALVRRTPGFIPVEGPGVSYTDVIAEAVFDNPGTGAWTYGLLFRQRAINTFYAVFVGSDGYWHHHVRNGSVVSDRELKRGESAAIVTTAPGRNHMLVLAAGTAGALFINGRFAGDLDLSELQGGGDVKVFAGYFNFDQAVGVSTTYEAFTVRPAG